MLFLATREDGYYRQFAVPEQNGIGEIIVDSGNGIASRLYMRDEIERLFNDFAVLHYAEKRSENEMHGKTYRRSSGASGICSGASGEKQWPMGSWCAAETRTRKRKTRLNIGGARQTLRRCLWSRLPPSLRRFGLRHFLVMCAPFGFLLRLPRWPRRSPLRHREADLCRRTSRCRRRTSESRTHRGQQRPT
jgi:hypothetical protein